MSTQNTHTDERQPSTPWILPDVCVSAEIAVAVPVRTRTRALERLLKSLPRWIDTVAVAETGDREERSELYERSYDAALSVVECNGDGIGQARTAAFDALPESTDYVWVVDNDMELPYDAAGLLSILNERDDLGGVSAMLDEPEGKRLGACHFTEVALHDGRDVLVQEFDTGSQLTHVPTELGTYRVIEADKLPQAGVFRYSAISDYGWDRQLGEYEHLDFFIGHHKQTEWKWAACPDIDIPHHRGTSDEGNYRDGIRTREERRLTDLERLRQKWDVDAFATGNTRWQYHSGLSVSERLAGVAERSLPARIWVPLKEVVCQ